MSEDPPYFPVECPDCGETVDGRLAEKKKDADPGVTVARRQTNFAGDITSLTELGHFGYIVELPCGCEVYTVN